MVYNKSMSQTPEKSPFGQLDSASMGDWLLEEKLRPRRIRKPLAIAVTPTNLPETIQPIEEKVPDQPVVVKMGPVK